MDNKAELAAKTIEQYILLDMHHHMEQVRAFVSPEKTNPELAVHDIRKCYKRIRAALRLLRSDIGEVTYQKTNVSFRDKSRLLADVRNAEILPETLEELAKKTQGIESRLFNDLMRVLEEKLTASRHRVRPIFTDMQQEHDSAKPLLFHLEPMDPHGIGKSLERIYRAGRKALAKAEARPSDTNLHEWRKQAKYLSNGLAILKSYCDEDLLTLIDDLAELTDLLGKDHDLVVLNDFIAHADFASPTQPELAEIKQLATQRRKKLQKRIFRKGRKCYKAKPRAIAKEFTKSWQEHFH